MPYLKLFHGRERPGEQLDEWGDRGRSLVPIRTSMRLTSPTSSLRTNEGVLTIVGDLVYFDGMFYGDWSVFDGPSAMRMRIDTSCSSRAKRWFPTNSGCALVWNRVTFTAACRASSLIWRTDESRRTPKLNGVTSVIAIPAMTPHEPSSWNRACSPSNHRSCSMCIVTRPFASSSVRSWLQHRLMRLASAWPCLIGTNISSKRTLLMS